MIAGQIVVALKGCFGKTLREYVLNEDFQFVLMSAGSGETLLGLIHLATILLRRIQRSNFASFLLYRGGALSEEDRFA